MARQATDSFVIEIGGAPQFVAKGEVLAEGHPVLKALPADTHLFRMLEEPEPPAKPTARTTKAAR
jgi:hypothetical protein